MSRCPRSALIQKDKKTDRHKHIHTRTQPLTRTHARTHAHCFLNTGVKVYILSTVTSKSFDSECHLPDTIANSHSVKLNKPCQNDIYKRPWYPFLNWNFGKEALKPLWIMVHRFEIFFLRDFDVTSHDFPDFPVLYGAADPDGNTDIAAFQEGRGA